VVRGGEESQRDEAAGRTSRCKSLLCLSALPCEVYATAFAATVLCWLIRAGLLAAMPRRGIVCGASLSVAGECGGLRVASVARRAICAFYAARIVTATTVSRLPGVPVSGSVAMPLSFPATSG